MIILEKEVLHEDENLKICQIYYLPELKADILNMSMHLLSADNTLDQPNTYPNIN